MPVANALNSDEFSYGWLRPQATMLNRKPIRTRELVIRVTQPPVEKVATLLHRNSASETIRQVVTTYCLRELLLRREWRIDSGGVSVEARRHDVVDEMASSNRRTE